MKNLRDGRRLQNSKALFKLSHTDRIYGVRLQWAYIQRAETTVRFETQEIPHRDFFRNIGSVISMDQNSGHYALHRYSKWYLSPIAAAAPATTLLRGQYRVRQLLTFKKKFKMHNKTYFFSSSLQIIFLRNSSTLLCLKKH